MSMIKDQEEMWEQNSQVIHVVIGSHEWKNRREWGRWEGQGEREKEEILEKQGDKY